MIGNHETWPVIFSIMISIMASYVAASAGNKARYRLAGVVLAVGTGAWATYFAAMLVFQLPIPMSYDIPVTLLSLLIVVLVSGFALRATNIVLEKRTTELSQANVLLQQQMLELIDKRDKLDYLAYYDALTGLPNRALFDDRMMQALRAASHEKSKTALVLIDLERFRVFNDTLGRSAGDELLKLVATRLQSVIFDRDSLARIHADLFAGLFPDIKDEADIARIVEEKIIACLNQPFTIAGQEVRVSAKIGVALFPGDATEPDALFSGAEAALMQAKGSSDRYLFYARKMNAFVAERLKLENKLQRALERGQFVLFYQPKVDLNSGRVIGLEALMRWNDPGTGMVPPMLFIPLLEETGIIVEVGAWAMKRAVSQYAAWQAAGLQPPPIAVNVSQVQLKRRDFVTSVQQAIAIAGKPEHGLDLEITESMIMEDIETCIEKLKIIRDLGVGISIDDFGTGHSSLRYLTRLPITALKIDRAFIQHMAMNADDVAIVSTVIALGHNLKLKVIAEGVETEEQRKFLQLLKCDQYQGYLFSKPMPAEQVPALLAPCAKRAVGKWGQSNFS